MPSKEEAIRIDKKLEKTIGERIKELLKKKGLGQKNLLLDAWGHLSKESDVSKRLNEHTHISYQEITAAADYLNVSVDYLLGREDQDSDNKVEDPGNFVSPRDFCRMLLSIAHGDFPFLVKTINNQHAIVFPYDFKSFEEDTLGTKTPNSHVSFLWEKFDGRFTRFYEDPDVQYVDHTLWLSGYINEFLGDFQKINALYLSGLITEDDYKILMEKRLSTIPDESFLQELSSPVSDTFTREDIKLENGYD